MQFALTQHPNGGLYAINRNDSGRIVAIAGPLSLEAAQEWFAKPTPLTSSLAELEWARQQAWRAPDTATMAFISDHARRTQRLRAANKTTALLVAAGLIILFLVSIGAWAGITGSGATATPSGSYAYRTIPMNQLTGADLLSMSFTERAHFVTVARQNIHCPSNVTDNDLTIALTQVVESPDAATQKATQLLASILLFAGCVT